MKKSEQQQDDKGGSTGLKKRKMGKIERVGKMEFVETSRAREAKRRLD
jgi:hypothetical protein